MILVLVEIEGGSRHRGLPGDVGVRPVAVRRPAAAIAIRAVVIGDVADRDALAAELGRHGVERGPARYRRRVRRVRRRQLGRRGAGGAAPTPARSVVTAAGTPRGNEVLAHLAARLDVPMAANVVAFSGLSPFTVTRQVVGRHGAGGDDAGHPAGALHRRRPLVGRRRRSTARPATWQEFTPEVAEADLVARVHSTGVKEADESGSLKSASIVVGAGRGAGGADGFAGVDELAELLGGVVGRLPRRDQPRLAAAPRAGRPDRQPDLAGPLHPVRHLRRDPALGRAARARR